MSEIIKEIKTKGRFLENLQKSNESIRKDRAVTISEGVELTYKRKIEDSEIAIKELVRSLDGMMDINPTLSTSLDYGTFDQSTWVDKRVSILTEIQIKRRILESIKTDYKSLFE